MMVALLMLVIVAAGLVILSGVWVAVALVAAVWHGSPCRRRRRTGCR